MIKEVSKYLVIIPTYNEKDNVKKLITEILKQDNLIDVLIIDDNSPDGTGEIVDQVVKQNKRVRVIHRSGKLGYGTAYVAGFKYALKNNYDLIFQMDGDFSHDPKYLPKLIEASSKYDLTLGSRWTKGGGVVGWQWYRYCMSWGANLIARTLLSLKPRDITTGFRCYNRRVLQKINLNGIVSSGYAFLEELLFRTQRAGFTIGEIPIIFVDRKAGKSKMGLKEITTSGKAIFSLFIRRKGVGQFVKFGIVGFSGAVVDFGILNILAILLKMNVYLSASISFIAAASNNFYWNKKWSFRDEAQNKKMHIQYFQYIIVVTGGFFINLLILRIFLPYFGDLFNVNTDSALVINLSKVVATIVVMVWNFVGSKKFVFNEAK